MSVTPHFESTSQSPFAKPFRTGLKIAALMLVVVAAASATEVGFYYLTRQSSTLICSNGATNYSSCNLCPSGQTLASGECVEICSNNAINPPICTRLSVVISASPDPSITGQPVTFSALTTGGTRTPICYWNFGDSAVDSGCSVTHTFSYAGTFMVSARVTESTGTMNDSATKTISEIVNQRTCSNSPFNPPAMNYSVLISIQVSTTYPNGTRTIRYILPAGAGEPGLSWASHIYDSYGIRCNYPVYMDPTNTSQPYRGFSQISVLSTVYHNYTLGDFFAVWGMPLGQNDTVNVPATSGNQWSMCVQTSTSTERLGQWDQEPLISYNSIILLYDNIGCI